MPISDEIRQQVRWRAHFACEYCGVRELEAGGELTIDHYRPVSKGGNDDPKNLVYCCVRCNLHKSDYWPEQIGDLPLWNPRVEAVSFHTTTANDGSLFPLTEIGAFTLVRLNLNRPQLIARRRYALQIAEEKELLNRRRDVLAVRLDEMRRRNKFTEEEQQLLRELLSLLRQKLSAEKGDEDVE